MFGDRRLRAHRTNTAATTTATAAGCPATLLLTLRRPSTNRATGPTMASDCTIPGSWAVMGTRVPAKRGG